MSRYHFLVPAMAVAFLLCASSQSVMAQPAQPYCGAGYGNGVMGFLTPEQRMMHFTEVQKATADMSFNDMRAYRWDFRNKVMAMNTAERKKFADDLAVKCDRAYHRLFDYHQQPPRPMPLPMPRPIPMPPPQRPFPL